MVTPPFTIRCGFITGILCDSYVVVVVVAAAAVVVVVLLFVTCVDGALPT